MLRYLAGKKMEIPKIQHFDSYMLNWNAKTGFITFFCIPLT